MVLFLSFGNVGFEMEDLFNCRNLPAKDLISFPSLGKLVFLACSSVVRKDVSGSVHEVVS